MADNVVDDIVVDDDIVVVVVVVVVVFDDDDDDQSKLSNCQEGFESELERYQIETVIHGNVDDEQVQMWMTNWVGEEES